MHEEFADAAVEVITPFLRETFQPTAMAWGGSFSTGTRKEGATGLATIKFHGGIGIPITGQQNPS